MSFLSIACWLGVGSWELGVGWNARLDDDSWHPPDHSSVVVVVVVVIADARFRGGMKTHGRAPAASSSHPTF